VPTDPASGQRGWSAHIDLTEHLGDTVLVYATVAGVEQPVSLKLAAEEAGPWQAGMAVTLGPKPGALHLFDAQGRRTGSV
jgi:multiple sugar transport system ATP-binding protein